MAGQGVENKLKCAFAHGPYGTEACSNETYTKAGNLRVHVRKVHNWLHPGLKDKKNIKGGTNLQCEMCQQWFHRRNLPQHQRSPCSVVDRPASWYVPTGRETTKFLWEVFRLTNDAKELDRSQKRKAPSSIDEAEVTASPAKKMKLPVVSRRRPEIPAVTRGDGPQALPMMPSDSQDSGYMSWDQGTDVAPVAQPAMGSELLVPDMETAPVAPILEPANEMAIENTTFRCAEHPGFCVLEDYLGSEMAAESLAVWAQWAESTGWAFTPGTAGQVAVENFTDFEAAALAGLSSCTEVAGFLERSKQERARRAMPADTIDPRLLLRQV